ncbi:MAG: glycosyltransferase family 39 protein [Planctomycetes bacterium]|nr:glycosyltransferase family 39 protein [Planctomycetota bacterium]
MSSELSKEAMTKSQTKILGSFKNQETKSWLLMVLVLCFFGMLFFLQLGGRALWSEELRWAQIPREMLQTKEYFLPTINGNTYYDKPLASYWLVIFSSWCTGTMDELACRLPSAISGMISVLFTMLIALRLYDQKTAIYSGIILGTSYSFVFFSRHASTDIENIAGILIALYLFLAYQKKPQGWWVLAFWITMALTSLTKGLLGFALPLLVAGVYSIAQNRKMILSASKPSLIVVNCFKANAWLFQWRTLIALPIAILVYLAPFLISLVWFGNGEGLSMVWRENIRRFYNPVNHIGPIYLYFGVIFTLLAPWSLLLPAALVQAFSNPKGGDKDKQSDLFALVYFISMFVFFTLASSRRSYYLLPVLPGAALLIASMLAMEYSKLNKWSGILFKTASYLLLGVVAAMLILLVPAKNILPNPWNTLPQLPHGLIFGLMIGTTLALGCWAIRRKEMNAWFVCNAWFAAFFMVYLFQGFFPAAEAYRTQKEFLNQVRLFTIQNEGGLCLYKTREAVFYLGNKAPMPEYHSEEKLMLSYKNGGPRWVLMKKRDSLSPMFDGRVVLEETNFPWEGTQAKVKLALVDLAGKKPASQVLANSLPN